MEAFYLKHQKYLRIFDEYTTEYSWDEYKERIFNHTKVKPKPCKWVYGIDQIDTIFKENPRKRIHLEECEPEEAEIWTPFDHVKYFETEAKARRAFPYDGSYFYEFDHKHWNDPDYPIDWTEGDFS